MKSYTEYFLDKTIYLLSYFLMGVSFLSIALPWFGFEFNIYTWGNFGGFSIITNILFIKVFYFNKKYCWLTRNLPFALMLISIINIICTFTPEQYKQYEKFYEVIIFSVILIIGIIICINKKLNS